MDHRTRNTEASEFNTLNRANVPRYVYDFMEIQKIGIFSKDVKKASKFFSKILPDLVKRPSVAWRWETRYSASKTNRRFKKEWYSKYHSMSGLPEKKVRVYCGRPQGPGPLVKLEKQRRKDATGWATAQEHRRVQRGSAPPSAFGPIRPVRAGVYTIPARRSGKTELTRQKRSEPQARIRAVGRLNVTKANETLVNYLGGRSYVLPAEHHKKYWYFLRKRGTYRFSTHHPYGDELDHIQKIVLNSASNDSS